MFSSYKTALHNELKDWFKKNLNSLFVSRRYFKLVSFLLKNPKFYQKDLLLLQEMQPFVLHMFGFADIDKTPLKERLTEEKLTDALYQHLSRLKSEKGVHIEEELIQGLAQLFIAKIDDDEDDNSEVSPSDPAGSKSVANSDDQIFTLDL